MGIAYLFYPIDKRDEWFADKGVFYLKHRKDVFMDLFVTGPSYQYQSEKGSKSLLNKKKGDGEKSAEKGETKEGDGKDSGKKD